MSSERSISAKNVGKAYAIYKRPEDRLKQMLWRGRRKYYTDYWALQGVDLEVSRGETIGIIGRNGSGKSTFLQLICGTSEPTVGELEVNGRVAALLELGAGFNPEFTGKENVFLSATVLGLTQKQIEQRYAAITEFAGIGDFIEHPVKIYSSGMYARLAFSVAAHVDADILIIDEILAVGDVAFNQKCMRYLREFKQRGTLFFTSHDLGAVVNLCDRVVWLESGQVREIGIPKDVCYRYLASFEKERENTNHFRIGGTRKANSATNSVRDSREAILKSSALQNKIELFDFDPNAPWFGERGAHIENVQILNKQGEPFQILEGGEEATLKITCRAENALVSPIVGFFVRDRLGQNLFGDNTYLTYRDSPQIISAGTEFCASFEFQLPYLPTGDYSVVAALAEGTQEQHKHHHWIDEALIFRVHSSHVVRGLIGIPIQAIEISWTGGTSNSGAIANE